MRRKKLAMALALLMSACTGEDELVCEGAGSRFVTSVEEFVWGDGQSFGRDRMPHIVEGPPLGGGTTQGSTDVVSMGNGGLLEVGFVDNGIVDGPGTDFVVFENPFETPSGAVFAELGSVSVSDDGERWFEFACTASEPPYGDCAGHHPVHLNGVDGPFDPETSGGDPFDLAVVGLARARYVRIVDRPDLEGFDGVFDLDAIGIVHAACP